MTDADKISKREAKENFNKCTQIVDDNGSEVIAESNAQKRLNAPCVKDETLEIAKDEELFAISDKLIKKNRVALRALAKW